MTTSTNCKRTIQLLETLQIHPLLSCEQLEMHLGWRKRTVQWHLAKSVKAKWICPINGHQTVIAARPLYALTHAGIKHLAFQAGMNLDTYLEVYRYQTAQLEQLVLVLDQVYRVRAFLLQLKNAKWGWSLTDWDIDVERKFWTREYDLVLSVHGIARLKNAQDHWITMIVEFDTNKAPVWSQRTRLARLVEGLSDDRFSTPEECPSPIFVILAATWDRLWDYRTLLFQLQHISHDLPRTFLTTQQLWNKYHQDPTVSVWKTEGWQDEWTSLLNNIPGGTQQPADYLPWERLPHSRRFSDRAVEIKRRAPGTPIAHRRHDLAGLARVRVARICSCPQVCATRCGCNQAHAMCCSHDSS